MRHICQCLLILGLTSSGVVAGQQARQRLRYPPDLPGAKVETYKTIGDVKLNMYIFNPAGHAASDRRPAIVFFFGGGWRSGSPGQFHEHCKYLASRGMVAMTADYRVATRHKTKAIECVRDAKSAVRWIRSNAERLGVDPNRIAAGGGSAGGHIAACTGTVHGVDEPGEDASISSVPNALVLFNPALVLASVDGEKPFGEQMMAGLTERMGTDPKELSPYHHVKQRVPPTIIFHGTSDTTVPFWTAKAFTEAMNQAGNQCKLVPYEGAQHGFFNFGRDGGAAYKKTVREMDQFLHTLGYLAGEPTIE